MSIIIKAVDLGLPGPTNLHNLAVVCDGAAISATRFVVDVGTASPQPYVQVTRRESDAQIDLWVLTTCQGLDRPVTALLHFTSTPDQAVVVTTEQGKRLTGWATLHLEGDWQYRAVFALLRWEPPDRDGYDDSASFEAAYAVFCEERTRNQARLGVPMVNLSQALAQDARMRRRF